LLLLSGGLDGTLAGKILLEEGIEVETLHFSSLFRLDSMAAAASTITPNLTK
jgi:adenylyl- and sulfurtransferase ThiI